MSLHPEILGPRETRVLQRLAPPATRWGYYLAGGTALALHLGHRRSDDFDWMSTQALPDPMDLAERLRQAGVPVKTQEVAKGTLHGSVSRVRVSFFEYRYPLLRSLVRCSELGVSLASLEDLACMKLAAVAQRGSRKDFVDVYAIGRERIPLGRMLALYGRKYSTKDVGHVLYGLAYFEDADRERMPRMVWDVSWPTVKRTISEWVTRSAGK